MVKSGLADLLEADIQDPTDFPTEDTAPGLRGLDAALRCKICSELYDAPVILPCGHTFCSLVRYPHGALMNYMMYSRLERSAQDNNYWRNRRVRHVGRKRPKVP